MEQPSTVMLNADYADLERRLAATAARRSRGMGLLGMMAALGGMPIEDVMEKLVGGAVAQEHRIKAETQTINRLNRQLTGQRGGTGACGECGKTISANKEYCFAHSEPSSRTPKKFVPAPVLRNWVKDYLNKIHNSDRPHNQQNS